MVETTRRNDSLVDTRAVNWLEVLKSQIEEAHSTITASSVIARPASCSRLILSARGSVGLILLGVF